MENEKVMDNSIVTKQTLNVLNHSDCLSLGLWDNKVDHEVDAVGIYVHPPGGWTYYFCFFCRPSSRLVSGHLKEKYLSYLYQIWHGCLLG